MPIFLKCDITMFIENLTRPSIQLVYQIVLTLNKIIQSEM
jgi:hypothetical protein